MALHFALFVIRFCQFDFKVNHEKNLCCDNFSTFLAPVSRKVLKTQNLLKVNKKVVLVMRSSSMAQKLLLQLNGKNCDKSQMQITINITNRTNFKLEFQRDEDYEGSFCKFSKTFLN